MKYLPSSDMKSLGLEMPTDGVQVITDQIVPQQAVQSVHAR